MTRLYPWFPALLAAVLAWQLVSGRAFLYIGDRNLWLLILSIPLLVAMTAVQLGVGGQPARAGNWVLLAPALLFLLLPAKPLGSETMEIQTSGAAKPSTATWDPSVPLVAVTPDQEWDLKQLGLQRLNDAQLTGVTSGRARLLGFVYRPRAETLGTGQFFVARFLVRCCTADAIALSFPVHYATADALVHDTWVEVRGPIKRGDVGGYSSLLVEAESVVTVSQPEHPYLLL